MSRQAAIHPPRVSREERRALFGRCFDTLRDADAISGWFFGAPASALRRENVRDWVLWALFGADAPHRDEVLDRAADEVEDYVRQLETIAGHEFAEGRNEAVRSMRVTLDPVTMLHRPFAWYTVRASQALARRARR